MRRVTLFPCAGETLVGTVDEAAGTTGLLIVSGGNEVRAGAHRGMAMLAARVAAAGYPVWRYDRRGVGDSSGPNGGWDSAAPDMAAAVAAFRSTCPAVRRIVGFGNCDGATALALFGRDAGIDDVVLANPWVVEPVDDLPPAAAIRAHYLQRLRDPQAWLTMIRGGIDFGKLFRGLRRIARTPPQVRTLADRVFTASTGNPVIVLARGDATAIAFTDAATRVGYRHQPLIVETSSHSFARAGDADALFGAILARLAA